jgi:KipI family sensor histidine kinase inhibitor
VTATPVRDAGDSAWLVELGTTIDPVVNARAIAMAAALRAGTVPGVRDIVPTYCSVAVYFDPLTTDLARLHAAIERAAVASPALAPERVVEIPIVYGGKDGPDLAAVAGFAGLSEDEVAVRHSSVPYRVYMLGFLPGFAYMGTVDARIAAPRHPSPRARVVAGAVGIAGGQTGVYPMESPGGWQIIGRTPVRVFDPSRTAPALFAAGDTVKFVRESAARPDPVPPKPDPAGRPQVGRHVTILEPGLFTTIQDAGRWGHQSSGVPVSGPMDPLAHRAANAMVGNERNMAALEVTLLGPEIRIDAPVTLAIAGADLGATLDGHDIVPMQVAAAKAGSVLRFGSRRHGARAYLAFDGGISTAPLLGSRSTHAVARLGGVEGRRLRAGDRLALGPARPRSGRRAIGPPAVAGTGGGARVRVLPGPQQSRFSRAAYDVLQASRFTVTPQSDRMAYRLHGSNPIPRHDGDDMISDATFTGSLQVPASGEPLLLMADRQTSGGYPQIATVITADLPLVAQLAPADWLEFRICSRAEAIAALIAQEAQLLGLE